jgi:hypothetical protein
MPPTASCGRLAFPSFPFLVSFLVFWKELPPTKYTARSRQRKRRSCQIFGPSMAQIIVAISLGTVEYIGHLLQRLTASRDWCRCCVVVAAGVHRPTKMMLQTSCRCFPSSYYHYALWSSLYRTLKEKGPIVTILSLVEITIVAFYTKRGILLIYLWRDLNVFLLVYFLRKEKVYEGYSNVSYTKSLAFYSRENRSTCNYTSKLKEEDKMFRHHLPLLESLRSFMSFLPAVMVFFDDELGLTFLTTAALRILLVVAVEDTFAFLFDDFPANNL